MSIESLMTAQWLVELTDEEKAVYAAMRQAEEGFITYCQVIGCTVLSGSRRQALILVPPGVTVPTIDRGLYAAWANVLQDAALSQGKNLTIGARSSQPPLWVENGRWVPHRPKMLATRVTWRKNAAARGAQITAEEALDYLHSRVINLTRVIGNSLKAGQKARAHEQLQKLDAAEGHLRDAVQAVERAKAQGLQVSAQILSGEAWKLRAFLEDGTSFTFSVPSIGLLSVVDCVEVSEARRKPHETRGEVIELGPLRLKIT